MIISIVYIVLNSSRFFLIEYARSDSQLEKMACGNAAFLIHELEIPQDLEPYVRLQKSLSELNEFNYNDSLQSIIQLLSVIDFYEICTNAFYIASKHLHDAPIIAKLLSEICKVTNKQIELKPSENLALRRMFDIFLEKDVLTPGAKVDYRLKLSSINSTDPIQRYIENDDAKGLAEYISLYPDKKMNTISFDYENEKRITASQLNYCAYYGSVKCFKYLYLEGSLIDLETPKFAVMGGSLEIIRLCIRRNADFSGLLFIAAYHIRNDIYNWILLNYESDPISLELLTCTNNILALYNRLASRSKVNVNYCLIRNSVAFNSSAALRVYKHFNVKLSYTSLFKYAVSNCSLDVVRLLYDPKFSQKIGRRLIEKASNNRKSVAKFVYEHRNDEKIYDLTNALSSSVNRNDIDVAHYLLKRGVPSTASGLFDYIDVLFNARSNEMFELLLPYSRYVVFEQTTLFYQLIQHTNIYQPSDEIVSSLIKMGASINVRLSFGTSHLIHAIRCAKIDNNWVPCLLKNDANPHVKDKLGSNALHYACKYNKHFLIKELVQAGIDPNEENKWGNRPLCLTRQTNVILEMVKNGASTDFIWKRHPYIVTLYLKHCDEAIKAIAKCGHNIKYDYNDTPLFVMAARDRKYDISELSFDNSSGEVLALLALEHQKLEDCDFYFFNDCFSQNPAQFATITNKRGDTALHHVMAAHSYPKEKYDHLLKNLINNGADVNAQNIDGITPAMNAIKARNQNIVLLWDKIDINIVDKNGRSIVHYAAMYDFMWNEFLSANGNVCLRDNFDMFPFQLAPFTSVAREALTPIDLEPEIDLYNLIKKNVKRMSHFLKSLLYKY